MTKTRASGHGLRAQKRIRPRYSRCGQQAGHLHLGTLSNLEKNQSQWSRSESSEEDPPALLKVWTTGRTLTFGNSETRASGHGPRAQKRTRPRYSRCGTGRTLRFRNSEYPGEGVELTTTIISYLDRTRASGPVRELRRGPARNQSQWSRSESSEEDPPALLKVWTTGRTLRFGNSEYPGEGNQSQWSRSESSEEDPPALLKVWTTGRTLTFGNSEYPGEEPEPVVRSESSEEDPPALLKVWTTGRTLRFGNSEYPGEGNQSQWSRSESSEEDPPALLKVWTTGRTLTFGNSEYPGEEPEPVVTVRELRRGPARVTQGVDNRQDTDRRHRHLSRPRLTSVLWPLARRLRNDFALMR
ncbi:hypothetical protein J6590_058783 [Homalodisca vitripennis]|nr:hypothetical protein J6590_058783 [Homalodisca vitripennis]